MNRIIKCATPQYLKESLDLVKRVFTDSEGIESGKTVRSLVEEMRGFKTSYDYGIVASPQIGLPAAECLMVKELVNGSLKNFLNFFQIFHIHKKLTIMHTCRFH